MAVASAVRVAVTEDNASRGPVTLTAYAVSSDYGQASLAPPAKTIDRSASKTDVHLPTGTPPGAQCSAGCPLVAAGQNRSAWCESKDPLVVPGSPSLCCMLDLFGS